MARIDSFTELAMQRNVVHEGVEATYTIFQDELGGRYLQIDTYGSPSRKVAGKKSQSIQLSPKGIGELQSILKAFDG